MEKEILKLIEKYSKKAKKASNYLMLAERILKGEAKLCFVCEEEEATKVVDGKNVCDKCNLPF